MPNGELTGEWNFTNVKHTSRRNVKLEIPANGIVVSSFVTSSARKRPARRNYRCGALISVRIYYATRKHCQNQIALVEGKENEEESIPGFLQLQIKHFLFYPFFVQSYTHMLRFTTILPAFSPVATILTNL